MQCHQFRLASNTRQQWPETVHAKLPKTEDYRVLCTPITVNWILSCTFKKWCTFSSGVKAKLHKKNCVKWNLPVQFCFAPYLVMVCNQFLLPISQKFFLNLPFWLANARWGPNVCTDSYNGLIFQEQVQVILRMDQHQFLAFCLQGW